MKSPADMDSSPAILIIRNTLWAFPYLAVMGLIWGYLADASSGAIAGLLIAAATSVWVGKVTTISSETSKESSIGTFRNPGSKSASDRGQSVSDLNIVRYHKLCHQFDDALIKIDEVLAKDPDFVEALLLKARILWEGFEDARAARQCLLKILAGAPDEKAVFHRWALNFYEELSRGKN
jgi:tetratricopeptide (TPR) repeat protein